MGATQWVGRLVAPPKANNVVAEKKPAPAEKPTTIRLDVIDTGNSERMAFALKIALILKARIDRSTILSNGLLGSSRTFTPTVSAARRVPGEVSAPATGIQRAR
jgi:hypothetical protein